jgi:hypothetical protein
MPHQAQRSALARAIAGVRIQLFRFGKTVTGFR